MSDSDRNVNRRAFLRDLAVIGVSASALSSCGGMFRMGSGSAGSRRIGLQLYTVRDLMEKDFEGTIERVATIGYSNLEFAGYFNRSPEQVRALLDRLHIASTSAHIGADLMRTNADLQIRIAQTIGQQYITIPSYAYVRDGGIASWQRAASEFNAWGELCRKAGLKLAYHNHAAEMVAVPGGPLGLDVLLKETDPALVDFEMDLYWTVFADQDPVAWFTRYPGRFRMWHTKDLVNADGKKSMAPVGSGSIDFRNIFAHASDAGLKEFFVEHDTAANYPGGSLASVTSSYTYLKQLLA